MKYENALKCALYLPFKIILSFTHKGRITFGKRSIISVHTTIRTNGKNAKITIGKHFSLSQNSELHADNGQIIVGDNVFINRNCIIASKSKISIGDNTSIGPNTIIYDHDHDYHHIGSFKTDEVKIGNNVWIGGSVVILKGVVIGNGSVISAGSVISKDVPEGSIVIQKRNSEYREIDPCKRW